MEKKNNSAGRLWGILGQISKTGGNTNMLKAWMAVLRIGNIDQKKAPFEIARKIDLLQDELIEARREMQKKHYSEDIYSVGFEAAEAILQMGAIYGNIDSYRNHLTPEALKALKFVAETIPDDEDEVTPEQLSELQAEIDRLREKIESGDLPSNVKLFIYKQIAIIENAIRDYSIVGAKAFKTAFDEALPDIAMNKEDIAEYAETEEIKTLGTIWDKAIQYGGNAFKYGSYAATAVKVIETVIKITGYLNP